MSAVWAHSPATHLLAASTRMVHITVPVQQDIEGVEKEFVLVNTVLNSISLSTVTFLEYGAFIKFHLQ